ncbi:hypothetical protein [Spongiactinospora rosea]|uniref:hypothetical protein n=1 Tax=Spongiactinospora rosea TaxID=2248750 RepID=UPI001CECDFAF|nr:hypothetical protein [Spongiactinospora rosea]
MDVQRRTHSGHRPSGRHEPASFEEWIEDGRARSLAYAEKAGIAVPEIDWSVFTGGR